MTALKACRLQTGHTNRQIAELLSVSVRTVEEWIGGRNPMPAAMLKLYRHVAGIERIPFKSL